MHYAAAGGQADIMKVLLAEGADADLVDKVNRDFLYWIFQRIYLYFMFACIKTHAVWYLKYSKPCITHKSLLGGGNAEWLLPSSVCRSRKPLTVRAHAHQTQRSQC